MYEILQSILFLVFLDEIDHLESLASYWPRCSLHSILLDFIL